MPNFLVTTDTNNRLKKLLEAFLPDPVFVVAYRAETTLPPENRPDGFWLCRTDEEALGLVRKMLEGCQYKELPKYLGINLVWARQEESTLPRGLLATGPDGKEIIREHLEVRETSAWEVINWILLVGKSEPSL